MKNESKCYSSSMDIQMEQEYLYQAYPYLRKENSPVYGVADPKEIVYKQMCFDELCYLLAREGTYLVMFGGPWCRNTNAVIDYVNYYARKYGVDSVYQFDFRIDGESARSSFMEDITAQRAFDGPTRAAEPIDGADFNYLYGEIVSRFLPNLKDWTDYRSEKGGIIHYLDLYEDVRTVPRLQTPFLFLYNKDNQVDHSKNAGSRVPAEGKTFPIVYAFEPLYFRDETDGKLYSDSEIHDEHTLVSNFEEQLEEAIFSHIGEPGLSITPYTHADYIREAYRMNQRGHTLKTQDAFTEDEQINMQMITLPELNWILDQDGTFILMFAGAWCSNSQAGIATVNDYAVANHLRIYVFDFRVDGKYPIDFWKYPRGRGLQIRSEYNPLKQLYVDMLEQHFSNVVTSDQSKWESPVIQYVDESGKQHVVGRMQEPYLITYQRDALDSDGKPAQILAYSEKMFELVNFRDIFIYSAPNYEEYKTEVYGVISAYCEQVKQDPVQITIDRTAPVVDGVLPEHVETVAYHKDHDWATEKLSDTLDDED